MSFQDLLERRGGFTSIGERSAEVQGRGFAGIAEREKAEPQVFDPFSTPPQAKFQSEVMLVLAPRREGKGLFMQFLQALMRERFERWKADYQIFANYSSTLADTVASDLVEQLSIFPEWAQNSIVFIDEIANAIPSVKTVSDINQGFSHFLTQVGKRNIDVVAATQFARMLDMNMLLQVNWAVNIRKISEGRGIKVRFYDVWGNILPGLEMRRPQIPAWWEYDRQFKILGTDHLWNTYNTAEIVPPLRFKKTAAAQYAAILQANLRQFEEIVREGEGDE